MSSYSIKILTVTLSMFLLSGCLAQSEAKETRIISKNMNSNGKDIVVISGQVDSRHPRGNWTDWGIMEHNYDLGEVERELDAMTCVLTPVQVSANSNLEHSGYLLDLTDIVQDTSNNHVRIEFTSRAKGRTFDIQIIQYLCIGY